MPIRINQDENTESKAIWLGTKFKILQECGLAATRNLIQATYTALSRVEN